MNNQVQIIGHIARNLELKKIDKTSVINVTLACTRNFKNKEGNYDTDFISCTVFDQIASNTCEYCSKGDIVGVKGRYFNRKVVYLPEEDRSSELKKGDVSRGTK